MAQERLFELPELVATDACPRIEVVRRNGGGLGHRGEFLGGQRFPPFPVFPPLGPRTALDRDQRLNYVRRRNLRTTLHGAFLDEHVTDVGEQEFEPRGGVVFSARKR